MLTLHLSLLQDCKPNNKRVWLIACQAEASQPWDKRDYCTIPTLVLTGRINQHSLRVFNTYCVSNNHCWLDKGILHISTVYMFSSSHLPSTSDFTLISRNRFVGQLPLKSVSDYTYAQSAVSFLQAANKHDIT